MNGFAESLKVARISKVWVELGDIRNPVPGWKIQISFEGKVQGGFMCAYA
jgi:hypothetical protein